MRGSLSLSALVLTLGACVHHPPPADHQFGPPPTRAVARETLAQTRSATIGAPPEELLAWVVEVPLEDVFGPYRSIPAVTGSEPLAGRWPDEGAQRRVLLADGHQAAEVLLERQSGSSFTYQVWGFTNAAGDLASYAIGRFEVAPEQGGSRLTWTYAFRPKSGLARLPLSIFVSKQWSGYMTVAFDRLASVAQQHFADPPHAVASSDE